MKKASFALFIGILILLTACGNTSDTQATGEPQLTQEDAKHTMPSDYATHENEMLDLDTYTLENKLAEYPQGNYETHYVSRGENGYYYKGKANRLECFDFKSKTSVVVCDKPNCMHFDASCVANPDNDWGIRIYNQGYIYYVTRGSGYMNLNRIAEDGSLSEACMTLYRYAQGTSELTGPEIVIHKDNVFYIDLDEEKMSIRKSALGEENWEVIFTTGRKDGNVGRMKIYGDFLFFQAGTIDEQTIEVKAAVYAYNLKTGETKLVLNNVLANYSLVGTKILYVYDGDIYSYDLRTADNVKLIEDNGGPCFVNNSQYIVTEKLKVYTMEGEYVCNLAIGRFSRICGMDEDYIIAQKGEELLLKPISELDDKPFEEYICED